MTFDTPTRLLEMPTPKAQEAMNGLDLESQVQMVLAAPWKSRQELILLSARARELVRAMPVEELFWSLKAIGPTDALGLVELASMEQLQFVFDLDWWKKDRLVPSKVAAWLVLLMEANPALVSGWTGWIRSRDESLLPAALTGFLRLVKRPDEMDPQEAQDLLPPLTFDNIYYFEAVKKELEPLVLGVMKLIFQQPSVYRDTLETIWTDPPSVYMESALRWRRSRLGDWGLVDYHDSLEILAPLPEGRIRPVAGVPMVDGEAFPVLPAFVPTLYAGGFPLLSRALARLAGSSAMPRLVYEWTGAANKLMMARGVDLDDTGAMGSVLEEVAGALNLALEHECERRGVEPWEVLAGSVLEDLVRLAVGLVRPLVDRLELLVKKGMAPPDWWCLPEEWVEACRGLLDRVPVFVGGERRRGCFFSKTQLNHSSVVVSQVEAWARAFSVVRPHWSLWSKAFDWDGLNFSDPRELTWPVAMSTALSRVVLGEKMELRPLDQGELEEIASRLRSAGPAGIIERAMDALGPLEGAGVDPGLLRPGIEEGFYGLEQEVAGVEGEIDPRFVQSVLARVAGGK